MCPCDLSVSPSAMDELIWLLKPFKLGMSNGFTAIGIPD